MQPAEMSKLIGRLSTPDKWCQHAEARDSAGNPVQYNDAAAVAWDLVGGICCTFGWERACGIFNELSDQVGAEAADAQKRAIAAMIALQDFNDDPQTTYDMVINRIRAAQTGD